MENLFTATRHCVLLCDPEEKVQQTKSLVSDWNACTSAEKKSAINQSTDFDVIDEPGRPDKPNLVDPRKLPRRSINTSQGTAALLHAITHIEFNAINLALDAAYRFRQMPVAYYDDWLRVADEEANHFELLNARLNETGYCYGDFDAHNGLWDMAMCTAHDVLVRMALVPRVMEARGLDVTPGIIDRFKAIDDHKSVGVLEIIMREEVGHVEIGSHWFHYLCDQRNLPRERTYLDLMNQYAKGKVKPPLHREARLSAGFTESELEYLEGMI
jgi:uncharacterized ferritin-like protein (DUF455 family)